MDHETSGPFRRSTAFSGTCPDGMGEMAENDYLQDVAMWFGITA